MKKLAEAAQINRSTIYQYYDSILSVLGDCISHKAGNANRRIPDPNDVDFLRQVQQVVLDAYRGIKENTELYQLVHRCGSKFGPARHAAVLRDNTLEFYRGVTAGLIAQDDSLAKYESLLPTLLSDTSGLIVRQWTDSGCQESPETVANLTMTVFGGIISSLKHSGPSSHHSE